MHTTPVRPRIPDRPHARPGKRALLSLMTCMVSRLGELQRRAKIADFPKMKRLGEEGSRTMYLSAEIKGTQKR